ncbi:hypothetical protein [Hydrogenophaga atypica]|uniref:Uncharacterized protein n=1 Tax=Hydrogenophaga atypica TaxID=249409 RepID=A0ABW2QLW2_9BURK
MTGFFIAVGLLAAMGIWLGYMNIKHGNPLVESDRKLMEQGKQPDLL